jgi:hypothetical protein
MIWLSVHKLEYTREVFNVGVIKLSDQEIREGGMGIPSGIIRFGEFYEREITQCSQNI